MPKYRLMMTRLLTHAIGQQELHVADDGPKLG